MSYTLTTTTPPSCIAANQDTVYYISPTTNRQNELACLDSVLLRLVGTFDLRHLTLSYGSSQSTDPQYIILNGKRTVQVIDLTTGNGAFVTMTNITDTMKRPALTADTLPVTCGSTECEGSCKKNTG
ncbi:hypothetical protein BGZ82_003854 [Podila clonocystis]|nr:hypothetical protein BGZ82_003854 [Podila clonocystis]